MSLVDLLAMPELPLMINTPASSDTESEACSQSGRSVWSDLEANEGGATAWASPTSFPALGEECNGAPAAAVATSGPVSYAQALASEKPPPTVPGPTWVRARARSTSSGSEAKLIPMQKESQKARKARLKTSLASRKAAEEEHRKEQEQRSTAPASPGAKEDDSPVETGESKFFVLRNHFLLMEHSSEVRCNLWTLHFNTL